MFNSSMSVSLCCRHALRRQLEPTMYQDQKCTLHFAQFFSPAYLQCCIIFCPILIEAMNRIKILKRGAPPFLISQAATNLSVATVCTETQAGTNSWFKTAGKHTDALSHRFAELHHLLSNALHWNPSWNTDTLGQNSWWWRLQCVIISGNLSGTSKQGKEKT